MISAIGPNVAGLFSTTISVNILAIPNSDIEIRAPAKVRIINKSLSLVRGNIALDELNRTLKK